VALVLEVLLANPVLTTYPDVSRNKGLEGFTMAKLARFVLRDGSFIWVEVDDDAEHKVNRYQRVARENGSALATAHRL
jgi:hypothetical protein